MPDDTRRPDPKAQPSTGLPVMPGMDWAQAVFDGPLRFQASVAADTLRQLNAPILETLTRQREFAESLATAAEQIATAAATVEELARQHAAITQRMQAAIEPYLRYVEGLADLGAGRTPGSSGRGTPS
jgi:methyl-accepting chemotaxis protein